MVRTGTATDRPALRPGHGCSRFSALRVAPFNDLDCLRAPEMQHKPGVLGAAGVPFPYRLGSAAGLASMWRWHMLLLVLLVVSARHAACSNPGLLVSYRPEDRDTALKQLQTRGYTIVTELRSNAFVVNPPPALRAAVDAAVAAAVAATPGAAAAASSSAGASSAGTAPAEAAAVAAAVQPLLAPAAAAVAQLPGIQSAEVEGVYYIPVRKTAGRG